MPHDLAFCKRVNKRYQTVTIGVAGALARERACEKVIGSRFTRESMTESKIYFSKKVFCYLCWHCKTCGQQRVVTLDLQVSDGLLARDQQGRHLYHKCGTQLRRHELP